MTSDFDLLEALHAADGSLGTESASDAVSQHANFGRHRRRCERLARASTRSLLAALLGGVRCRRNRCGYGLLAGQCENTLLARRACTGKSTESQGNFTMNFTLRPHLLAFQPHQALEARLAGRLCERLELNPAWCCHTTSMNDCAWRARRPWPQRASAPRLSGSRPDIERKLDASVSVGGGRRRCNSGRPWSTLRFWSAGVAVEPDATGLVAGRFVCHRPTDRQGADTGRC